MQGLYTLYYLLQVWNSIIRGLLRAVAVMTSHLGMGTSFEILVCSGETSQSRVRQNSAQGPAWHAQHDLENRVNSQPNSGWVFLQRVQYENQVSGAAQTMESWVCCSPSSKHEKHDVPCSSGRKRVVGQSLMSRAGTSQNLSCCQPDTTLLSPSPFLCGRQEALLVSPWLWLGRSPFTLNLMPSSDLTLQMVGSEPAFLGVMPLPSCATAVLDRASLPAPGWS